jgi:dienelactone hydrolase
MRFAIALLAALVPAGIVFAQEKPPQVPPALLEAANKYLDLFIKGEYAEASKNYDETMTKVFPPDKLEATWKGLLKQVGALRSRGQPRLEKLGKYQIVIVPCTFEKAELNARIVFDAKEKISGLQFAPPRDTAADYKSPDYVNAKEFSEKDVKVGAGEWELPGILSTPNGAGPFPAIVLVHGSGAHDQDETIGPNKLFKDIAQGLASRGIAVLRYVKRNKRHGEKMLKVKSTLTLKEEVTDDALAAVELLRHSERINPDKIFVLGHSLGGMMAPTIGKADPRIAGLISMAGTSRQLDEVIVDQTDYLLSLNPPEEQKKALEDLGQKARAMIKRDLNKDVDDKELPLGLPIVYWRSVKAVDPPAIAKELSMPLLILQGASDFQVTKKDVDRWKSVLGDRKGVEYKWYPKLGHSFIPVGEVGKPSDYEKVGHVSVQVIDDIASWIKKN